MKTRLICLFVMPIFVISLWGCQTLEEHKGAVIGAGVGATAGALLGGDTEGAIVGGLLGALIGGAIGHYAYDVRQGAEETASRYDYKPSQGPMLTLEDASALPEVLGPGDTVEIEMTYAVLNPSADMETSVTEIREITHNGKLVGRPEVRVTRASGTYTSKIPIQLPKNAEPGVYDVRTVVQSHNAKDVRIARFSVQ